MYGKLTRPSFDDEIKVKPVVLRDHSRIFVKELHKFNEFQDISGFFARVLNRNGIRLVVFSFENVLISFNPTIAWLFDVELLYDFCRPSYLYLLIGLLLENEKMFVGILTFQDAKIIKGFLKIVLQPAYYRYLIIMRMQPISGFLRLLY
jgi:hypothetical protein